MHNRMAEAALRAFKDVLASHVVAGAHLRTFLRALAIGKNTLYATISAQQLCTVTASATACYRAWETIAACLVNDSALSNEKQLLSRIIAMQHTLVPSKFDAFVEAHEYVVAELRHLLHAFYGDIQFKDCLLQLRTIYGVLTYKTFAHSYGLPLARKHFYEIINLPTPRPAIFLACSDIILATMPLIVGTQLQLAETSTESGSFVYVDNVLSEETQKTGLQPYDRVTAVSACASDWEAVTNLQDFDRILQLHGALCVTDDMAHMAIYVHRALNAAPMT